jgi:hypothetical protein
MHQQRNTYFQQLVERVDSAVKVPFRKVRLDGVEPKLNDCHGNVHCWIRTHPETSAVRGWLFWPPDPAGRYRFMAHSVVDENGQLVDLTPIDPNTLREGLRFLRHEGAEKDFESMKIVCSEVLYPPMTIEELQASHLVDLEEEAKF